MVKVLIRLMVRGPYGSEVPQFEPIFVEKMPGVPRGVGPVDPGRWKSDSPYIGRTRSGKFLFQDPSPGGVVYYRDRGDLYGGRQGSYQGHRRHQTMAVSAGDPVARFFDTDDTSSPFLTLRTFDRVAGEGHFSSTPKITHAPIRFYFSWAKV